MGKKFRSWARYVFAVLLLVGGALVLLYPITSRLINERTQTSVAEQFVEDAGLIDAGVWAQTLAEAQAYNRALVNNQPILSDPFSDAQSAGPTVIDLSGIGDVLGTLEIPRINMKLPIYEGATDLVLSKGAGWLPGTSFPIGGASTHTVLSGHRGLPTAKLFSDIVKLEIGDEFFIRNTSDILAYKVVDIQIIEPEDVSYLAIVEGKDKATLLTCHPYMINSHRYLVMGERTAYTGQLEEFATRRRPFDVTNLSSTQRDFLLAILACTGVAGLIVFVFVRKRKKDE